jgi:TolA-binding protein
MTQCDKDPEAAERYVGGDMLEPERTGFEEHFFACDACFRTVQTLEDARRVLVEQGPNAGATSAAAPARGLPLTWMAAAATLVLTAGLGLTMWRVSRPTEVPAIDVSVSEAPAARPQAMLPAPVAQAPVAAPGAATSASRAASTRDRLERWAAVTPPQYVALTTRSGQDEGADENARVFDEAMAHYSAGRYGQASEGLQALADRAPGAAHVQFFLGMAELMSSNVARARGAFERCAASGVSPYADEAHFYLAKAALRAGDLTAATRELQIAVEREAGPEGEAAKLLAELRRLVR